MTEAEANSIAVEHCCWARWTARMTAQEVMRSVGIPASETATWDQAAEALGWVLWTMNNRWSRAA